MELGEKIARYTEAVGIKPCESCKQRAAALNEIGRRGVIQGGLLALFLFKESVLKAAWQIVGEVPPVTVDAALALVRQLNTVAVTQRFKSKTETYPTQKTLLTGEDGLISHKEHFKPGTLAYAWMSRVNFHSDEILPGWILDYVLVDEGKGYRLILKGKLITLATDEAAVIYEADTPAEIPKAKSLRHAGDFPQSQPYDKFASKATQR